MVKFKWEKEFKETPIGKIPKDWEVKEVGEIIRVVKNRIEPSKTPNEIFELYSIPSYLENGQPEIVLGKSVKSSKYLIKPQTILYGRLNPQDPKVWFVNKESEYKQITSTEFFPLKLKGKDSLLFIYYLLQTEFIRDMAEAFSTGTTPSRTRLSEHDFLRFKIPYPSPDEQQRIATVLSWFDDLIENKRRQNEILEKTAMAIFKSWFIDFEPFQDEEFVYSEELDMEIPKGWEVGKLVEIGEIIMGQSPPSKAYNLEGDGYPFVQGMGQFGLYVPNTDTYSKVVTKLSKPYDVLITVRAPIGELNIADRCYILGRGVSAIRSEFWPFVYLYLKVFNELLKAYERGTTFEAITKSELENFPILIPPKPILEKFHSLVEPLFRKIIINEKEIMVLKKARDTLLPQLVFGRLRVVEL